MLLGEIKKAVQQWEYLEWKPNFHPDSYGNSIELKRLRKNYMDNLGKEGWELVSVAVVEDRETLYFKRPSQ